MVKLTKQRKKEKIRKPKKLIGRGGGQTNGRKQTNKHTQKKIPGSGTTEFLS
jgi:hypothetical protein